MNLVIGLWKLNYCSKCLTTDLRPNASFINGVCIACDYNRTHYTLNAEQFNNRLKFLRSYLSNHLKKFRHKSSNKIFDCIVGVSGGKDSTRQAHWVRDRLGLRPLLVCVAYPPKQMTEIGAENISNLIKMGFDIEISCPAPQTSAQLSLAAFRTFGNVSKATEMALFAGVPKLAIERDIKLIFWGENPALQVGDAATLGENIFDGNNLRQLNTLIDGGYSWIHKIATKNKASFYKYPNIREFDTSGLKIIYLGPAWNDWSNDENSEYAALHGLSLRPYDDLKTGDISGASMLDEEFTNINMMLKYFKFGFGRATDTCCEFIRQGKMTREEGKPIVEKYDGICSDDIIRRYCNYVKINESEFWETANQFVNTAIFDKTSTRPNPKFTVGEGL